MKNRLLSIVALCFILTTTTKIAQSQVLDILSDPTLNYYETVEQINNAIEAMPATKSEEQLKEIKRFNRWNWFWQHRVDANGGFGQYGYELKQYYNSYSGNKAKSLPLWEPLGPTHNNGDGLSSGGEIGKVKCIWADRNNTNVVIIGSGGGGLWKSTNGGNTWAQLGKETIHGGALAIAVDPGNSDILYVGCGISFDGFSKSYSRYSTGIYKSTNGGQTFTAIDAGLPLLTEKVMQITIKRKTFKKHSRRDYQARLHSSEGLNNAIIYISKYLYIMLTNTYYLKI